MFRCAIYVQQRQMVETKKMDRWSERGFQNIDLGAECMCVFMFMFMFESTDKWDKGWQANFFKSPQIANPQILGLISL